MQRGENNHNENPQTKEEGVKLYSAVFLQSIVQRKFKEGDFGKDQRFD